MPIEYGPENASWCCDTTQMLAKIEIAAKYRSGVVLSSYETSKLAAVLWHLGVFK